MHVNSYPSTPKVPIGVVADGGDMVQVEDALATQGVTCDGR